MTGHALPLLTSASDIFKDRYFGLNLAVVQRLNLILKNEDLLKQSVTGDWPAVRPDTDIVALAFINGDKREFYAGRLINQRPSPRESDLFELVVDRFEEIGVHDLSVVSDAIFYGNKGGGGSRVYVANNGSVAAGDVENGAESISPLGGQERREVWIRKNHQHFSDKVWRAWNGQCAVTGVECNGLLVASHIFPWSRSNPEQKTEPENGLLLSSPLDALFDRGLIGFTDQGRLLKSPVLQPGTLRVFAINADACLTRAPSRKMRAFLKLHRELFGLNG